jgi:HTH-type transcriptional regulator / antitoxin HigA
LEKMNVIADDIQTHWCIVRPLFSIRDEHEYDIAIERLNALIDEVGTNEQHPLYELLDTLGAVVHAYEDKYFPMPECNDVEMLRFLMEEYQLGPSDFPELGTQCIVEEILNGERDFTIKHLKVLSEKFHVSPAVFL